MKHDPFDQLAENFFAHKRIAIWGVEDAEKASGEWVANRFRKVGFEVIAVNPAFDDDPARGRSSSLTHIDPPVEAVLLYTDPDETAAAIEDCVAAHPSIVWLHDALGPGATNSVAIERLEKAGVEVIPGLCPMLFLKPVDPGHFCIKWALKLSGKDRRVRRATREPAQAVSI